MRLQATLNIQLVDAPIEEDPLDISLASMEPTLRNLNFDVRKSRVRRNTTSSH
jgi:hypothetical protein